MSLLVPCPRCGPRPFEEFAFGGELRDPRSDCYYCAQAAAARRLGGGP